MANATIIFKPFTTLVTVGSNKCLCDSCTINENMSLLESSGGYAGKATGTDSRFNAMSVLDYGELTGSVGVTYTTGILSDVIGWTSTRSTSKAINISGGGSFNFGECYWTGLTIGTSTDSNVTGDISFYAKQRVLSQGTMVSVSSGSGGHSLVGNVCIPYWNTKITGTGGEVMSWTLTYGQELIKKFFLKGQQSVTPFDPDYIICGLSTCELSVSLLVASTSMTLSNYYKKYGSLSIGVNTGGGTINFSEAAVSSVSPTVVGDYYAIDITYKLMNQN